MKEPVSHYWISVVALVAAMSVVCVALVHYGYPWVGLALVSVAISAAVILAARPTRSLSEIIAAETGPGPSASKGKGTP
jgi:hypothetical protein